MPPTEDLYERTVRVLSSQAFRSAPRMSYEGAVRKLELIAQLGIAPMMVLPSDTLINLARIPHSTEGLCVDALDAVKSGGPSATGDCATRIYFLSHRWLRPDWCEGRGANLAFGSAERQAALAEGLRVGDPDDSMHSKAHALAEYARWLRDVMFSATAEHHHGKKIYFWIDFCSADQREPAAHIAGLPVYIANCSNFVTFHHPEYADRAWCRLEMLMHASFSPYWGVREQIQPGLTVEDLPTSEADAPWATTKGWTRSTLLDPRGGRLGNPKDAVILERLTSTSEQCAFTELFEWSFFVFLARIFASVFAPNARGWRAPRYRLRLGYSILKMHLRRRWEGMRIGGRGADVLTHSHRFSASVTPAVAASRWRQYLAR